MKRAPSIEARLKTHGMGHEFSGMYERLCSSATLYPPSAFAPINAITCKNCIAVRDRQFRGYIKKNMDKKNEKPV